MWEHEKKLIDFLMNAENYSHQVSDIQIIQTHISIISIAKPFVYKFKKGVLFDFLDYSTLEKRKEYCEKELLLNKKLCNNIYLDMVTVYDRERLNFTSGTVFEYGIKMVYMPPENNLVSYLNDYLISDKIELIKNHLAEYYRNTKKYYEVNNDELYYFRISHNLFECKDYMFKEDYSELFETIKLFIDQYYDKNRQYFDTRALNGYVADCHGDLRVDHIYVFENHICIYDCIEFNEDFRKIDIIEDISFLSMELDSLDYYSVSHDFESKIINAFKDKYAYVLLPYYKCFKSMIRAKVNMLLLTQITEDKKKLEVKNSLLKYLRLSVYYIVTLNKPVLFVFMGKIGSGKSTLSQLFSQITGVEIVSSDQLRKQGELKKNGNQAQSADNKDYYTDQNKYVIYNKIEKIAAIKLQNYQSLVIDATYSKKEHRDAIINLCEEKKGNIVFIEVELNKKIRKERLQKREIETGQYSDARLEHMEMLDNIYENTTSLEIENLLIKFNQENSVYYLIRNILSFHLEKQVKTIAYPPI